MLLHWPQLLKFLTGICGHLATGAVSDGFLAVRPRVSRFERLISGREWTMPRWTERKIASSQRAPGAPSHCTPPAPFHSPPHPLRPIWMRAVQRKLRVTSSPHFSPRAWTVNGESHVNVHTYIIQKQIYFLHRPSEPIIKFLENERHQGDARSLQILLLCLFYEENSRIKKISMGAVVKLPSPIATLRRIAYVLFFHQSIGFFFLNLILSFKNSHMQVLKR